MRFTTTVLGIAFALSVAMVATPALAQDPPHVISVFTIDPAGDPASVLGIVKRAGDINEKYGSRGVRRVWQATLAGAGTGQMFIAIEYPSLVAYAEDTSKVNASPEWRQLIQDAQKAGLRITDASLSVEVPVP